MQGRNTAESLHSEWFRHYPVGTVLNAEIQYMQVFYTRQYIDRYIANNRMVVDDGHALDAVQARHHNVEEHQNYVVLQRDQRFNAFHGHRESDYLETQCIHYPRAYLRSHTGVIYQQHDPIVDRLASHYRVLIPEDDSWSSGRR